MGFLSFALNGTKQTKHSIEFQRCPLRYKVKEKASYKRRSVPLFYKHKKVLVVDDGTNRVNHTAVRKCPASFKERPLFFDWPTRVFVSLETGTLRVEMANQKPNNQ